MANEKRLIDAIELISKARRMETTDNNGIPVDTFAVPVMVIEDATTVDAVEVVRCKNCKYQYTPDCTMSDGLREAVDDDFCSYGERRTDG